MRNRLKKTSKFRELWSPAFTKNTHTKYQSCTCNSAIVIAKVKVFVTDRRMGGLTDRRTDRRGLVTKYTHAKYQRSSMKALPVTVQHVWPNV